MAREQEQSGVVQNTALDLLSEAECQLQAGHFQKALAILQDGDKRFPKEKGVKEALAVAKVMVAVKGGIKRGCDCGARIQNDVTCDWYSVLRVDPQGDEATIKRKFKQYGESEASLLWFVNKHMLVMNISLRAIMHHS